MKKQYSMATLGLCVGLSALACDDNSKRGARDTSSDGANPRDGGGSEAGSGLDASADGGRSKAGKPTACDPTTKPALPALALRSIFTGLDRLVFAAQPKGTRDWYLVRQSGQILVSRDGAPPSSTPFLDVSSQISLDELGNEFGLLGLAFAPDYATSGKLYITLTPSQGENAWHDMVIEYQRSSADKYRVDPNSARVLLSLDSSSGNHNGGHVTFGPDNMLYVGTGDGGGSCNDDKPGAPQDRSALFGKILRLDPTKPAPHAAAGNPFSGATGDPRVLHFGLRNPYRFNFDFDTGHLYIGDVGQGTAEELSFAAAGAKGVNFGWPAHEGKHAGTCGDRSLAAGTEHTEPLVDIDRKESPASDFTDYVSIIAGHVYHGDAIPQLEGAFIFGDYEGDRLGLFRRCGTETSPIAVIGKRKNANSTAPGFGAPSGAAFSRLTAIVQDDMGELYFVANQNSLLKIEPAP